MSVYLRGKVWWCEFEIHRERIRKSTGQTSKRKAQEFERRLRIEYADNMHLQRAGLGSQKTYGEAVLKWMPTAPASMKSHIAITVDYLSTETLISVPSAAYEMRSDMKKRGLSNQTINRRLAVVRRVLNLAFNEWDWLETPLAQKIALLSESNTARDKHLTRGEVDDLLFHVEDETAKSILHLMAYTGLRKSEIRALKPDDWSAPYLTVRKSKSGKSRRVPVVKHLQHLVKLPFSISLHRLRVEFEYARVKIERPDIRMHDLRHSFGTWLAQDGSVAITEIRDLLGHSSLAVTSRYANIRNDSYSTLEKSLGSPHTKSTQSRHKSMK